MTARCPRCASEVGVRDNGTLRNHKGRGGELFCAQAGKPAPRPISPERAGITTPGPCVRHTYRCIVCGVPASEARAITAALSR
jgi:hypothetical protein